MLYCGKGSTSGLTRKIVGLTVKTRLYNSEGDNKVNHKFWMKATVVLD